MSITSLSILNSKNSITREEVHNYFKQIIITMETEDLRC